MKKIRIRRAIYKVLFSSAIIVCILLCMTDKGEGAAQIEQPENAYTEKAISYTELTVSYTPEPITETPEYFENEAADLKKEIQQISVMPTPEEIFVQLFPGEDYYYTIDVLAKVMWGECRGVKNKTNQAAVPLCVLRRVEVKKRGDNPRECATAEAQYAYSRRAPVKKYLRDIAKDILDRWLLEQAGYDMGLSNILPEGYVFMASYYDNKAGERLHRFRMYDNRPGQTKLTPRESEIY